MVRVGEEEKRKREGEGNRDGDRGSVGESGWRKEL